MSMVYEDPIRDAEEAKENLRVIRELMERSTKYSTFSGSSGVLAGLASILGCVATAALQRRLAPAAFQTAFLLIWSLVIVTAIGMDFVLTKRRAAFVGKRVISQLGKRMALASAPGLGTGALLTPALLRHGTLDMIFPVWMLCYGTAVSAVGLFSQREVSRLGALFLLAGAITLALPAWGLPMMAISFGGFHIAYGVLMSRKDGW